MKFGIGTPVVVQLPSARAAWEVDAGPDELIRIAETADQLGYHHLTCSEHVAVPASVEAARGVTYWDALATLSFLAARTRRIRLVTNVLVLGYHHPLALAKRYGTLDRLSGGRLVLGLGVGSLVEEFELLEAPFDDRGARADDALRALRAAWAVREPAYEGPYYRFAGLVVEPHAVQPHVPFWMGGRTAKSLARAVELADGWTPFALGPDQLARMLGRFELPEGFEVVLGFGGPVDPSGDPEGTRAAVEAVRALGATSVNVSVVHRSLDHYLEQLAAFAELVGLGFDGPPAG
jgi:probable F420-dependent oxidoreductase